ncbi:MAG: hypothetical protein ACI9FU_002384, partial [Granulosicoccus sp.]
FKGELSPFLLFKGGAEERGGGFIKPSKTKCFRNEFEFYWHAAESLKSS